MNIIEFNKKTTNLIEKYAPTKKSEIIGSQKQVYALVNWLKNYEKNAIENLAKQDDKKKGRKTRKKKAPKTIDEVEGENEDDEEVNDDEENTEDADEIDAISDKKKTKKKDPNICSCAIVTGDHGTGKTAMVKAVLNGMGYVIRSVNTTKLAMIDSVDDFVKTILTMNDVLEMIENDKNKKHAIMIDDIHSMSTPTEKNIISKLLLLNSELWACPVVFIGSNKHTKFMTGVKKECYHISLYPPTTDNLLTLLERVGLGEGMKLENEDVAVGIIKHSQNDYRRLIIILGELHRIHSSNVIKKTDLDKYIKFTGEKNIDGCIYDNTTQLFTTYNGINSALKVFEKDKTTMPLMLHQNHFEAMTRYIKDKSKSIDSSEDLSRQFAHGDVVDNYIYSDQNWSLQETYGFYSCVYPSFKMNREIDTSKLSNDSKYPYYAPAFDIQYPKDLNRTSTRCINYKNVKIANEYFKDMTIEDYVLAVKLIRSLLEDGRSEDCEKIVKEYNLTAQGIMYVLKIDKINGTRKDVSKYIEKKVKEIAVEPVKPAVIIKKSKNVK